MIEIQCYNNAERMFRSNQYVRECHCLPDCTAISYDIEMSQAQTRYSAEELALKNTLNDSDSG